jgi:hypothetical protein
MGKYYDGDRQRKETTTEHIKPSLQITAILYLHTIPPPSPSPFSRLTSPPTKLSTNIMPSVFVFFCRKKEEKQDRTEITKGVPFYFSTFQKLSFCPFDELAGGWFSSFNPVYVAPISHHCKSCVWCGGGGFYSS